MVSPPTDQHARRSVEGHRQRVEGPRPGFHRVAFDLGDISLVDVGGGGELGLCHPYLSPSTPDSLAYGLLGEVLNPRIGRGHGGSIPDWKLNSNIEKTTPKNFVILFFIINNLKSNFKC